MIDTCTSQMTFVNIEAPNNMQYARLSVCQCDANQAQDPIDAKRERLYIVWREGWRS